jgi:hypothetical protein
MLMQSERAKEKKENLPALTPDTPARFNPFFLIIKLAPMKRLELTASANPFSLSDDIVETVFHFFHCTAPQTPTTIRTLGRRRCRKPLPPSASPAFSHPAVPLPPSHIPNSQTLALPPAQPIQL